MFKKLNEWREERGLNDIEFNKCAQFGYIAEELSEGLKSSTDYGIVDSFADIIVFAINAIEAKGYDAEKVMDEVIKEISSRRGAYNPTVNKWEKDKLQDPATLYKADFSGCKK